MPGFIPSLPTDTSGAPELNRWDGVTQEPSLSERITGHVPYPGPPPAYDVENYARNRQYLLNLLASAVALTAQRASSTVTISGVTVGNQRRLTVNGTAVTYSDTGSDTLASVTQKFVDLINDDPTITAGANAAGAVYVSAGTLTVFASPLAGGSVLTVVAAVLAGAGTISASAVTAPDITIPSAIMAASGANNIVLGESANDAGPQNDVRLVLDRATNALRAGGTNGTEWDTRATNSVGLGWRANPQTQDSLAVGTQAVASVGQRAAAIGYQAAASAADAMAAGPSAAASAAQATALGYSASATAADAVSVGNSSASAARAIAIGDGASASGDSAIAIGNNTEASAIGALATGRNGTGVLDPTVKATGRGARAHGAPELSTLNGTRENVLASGVESDAMGEGCQASGDYSRATGYGAVATNRGEEAHASLGIAPATDGFNGQSVHQAGRIVAQARTNGAQTLRCKTDATSSNTGLTWTPRDDRGYWVDVRVVAKQGAGTAIKVWSGRGYVAVDAGTAVAAVTLTTDGGSLGVSDPTVNASGAGVYVEVDSPLADVVYWTCEIQYVQAGADY